MTREARFKIENYGVKACLTSLTYVYKTVRGWRRFVREVRTMYEIEEAAKQATHLGTTHKAGKAAPESEFL